MGWISAIFDDRINELSAIVRQSADRKRSIMYFVYALYNMEADKIYIGRTDNLEDRKIDHNRKRGNHFTAKFKGKWELIYKEQAKNRSQALQREKQLKSYRGRQFIKQYIPVKD